MGTIETRTLKRNLRDGRRLLGTFIKTPTVHATEILADVLFDFVVVDEEHGPFDRTSIDLLMLATSAKGISGIVRVAGLSSILPALDMGAEGVLIPHVNSAEQARAAVAASRYLGGERGCSPSSRAGRYGALALAEHVARADAEVSVSVMIEHPDAIRNVEEIAAVQGVDALFLGLGDLAVASGELTPGAPSIREAARVVCAAAQRQGKGLMATAATIDAGRWLFELGVNAFVVSSDQGLLRAAAGQQLSAFRALEDRKVRTS
jgi:2-keto-3-deoxy-L-rhamnonate aldolase RhmA